MSLVDNTELTLVLLYNLKNLCLLIGLCNLLAFNVIIDMVGFIAVIFPFVSFSVSHFIFVPLLHFITTFS